MQLELNKEQLAAADFLNGICVVVAVPGSGKTLTMTHRIGNLVKKHGIAPENILGLTFTRNAADAMREKLVPVLEDMASRVTLSTIHSFCHYLLRNEGVAFNVLSGKDQIVFLRNVMKKLKVKDLSIGMVLREISLAKNNLIDVEEFRALYEGDKSMIKVADIYEDYDLEKTKKFLLDFDDLLCESYRLLNNNNEIREKYRGTFRHLLVDEYQDTNPLQNEIFKILVDNSSNGSSFFVVGDDYQSIYGFTGASVSNIINFRDLFPSAEQLILNLNYRSTPQILKACQNLIQHNLKKIDKELRTENPSGDDVIVLESTSEETEALNLVSEINDLVERQGYAYKEIACLYRCNFQSRVIEETLQQYKIPYEIQNGLCFYDRREVKILLDYLRLIANLNSDEGDEVLRNIINVPNRYIGRKFISDLDDFQSGSDMHLYEKLQSMPVDLPYIRKNIREFIQLIDPLIEDSANQQPAELIQLLRVALDYDRFITDDDMPSPDDVKIENLNQLVMAAARFNDISSFLEYTETFQNESISDNRDGVKLMTVHRSKGLEFPVVFLVGLVENILPSKKGNLEEERRICFVGMSRAMKLLYLSHSLTYLGQPAKRSIFLNEILGSKEPPSDLK
ncbi:ATP-dependent helicase [Thermodesulfobacteriota bacterium]